MISRRAPNGRALSTWAAVLFAGPCAAGAIFVWLRSRAPEAPSLRDETIVAPDMPADWCAPGFEPIVGGGCLPPSARPRQPLILYLPGAYPRDLAGHGIDRPPRPAVPATPRGFAVT